MSERKGMNGQAVLDFCKGRKGEWLATHGDGVYVSGPLLVKWIKSYPKSARASVRVLWEGDTLTATTPRARLTLVDATGPSPREGGIPGGPGGGFKRAGARATRWKNAYPRLRLEALYLPAF